MENRICSECQKDWPITEFRVRRIKGQPYLDRRCNRCRRNSVREYTKKNRQEITNKVARNRHRVLEYINEAKRNKPCMDCGGIFLPCAMDFDHRPDEHKEFSVSQMRSFSFQKIDEEIAKCDLVCANCHRVRSWLRIREKLADKRAFLENLDI